MTAIEFWDIFESIEAFLLIEIDQMDGSPCPYYDALTLALWDYSEGLSWDHLNELNNPLHVLTITSRGNKDYFLTAINLVEQAPRFTHWEFQALVPPLASYTKDFFNAAFYMDGSFIKIKDLKVSLACVNDDFTYVIAFYPLWVFRDKNQNRLLYDLEGLLIYTLGERRFAQSIEFITIDYNFEYDLVYTTIDNVDKAMLEHEYWDKKHRLEESKMKNDKVQNTKSKSQIPNSKS